MPTTRVTRTLPAPPAAVWRVLDDPHHLPRWWPRVARVEGVERDRFTQVLAASSGKQIRADFRVGAREEAALLRWEQELDGSPFERLLASAVTTFTLVPADDGSGGTVVAVELRQRLRGWARLVPFLFRRAAQRQLGEALAALAAATAR
mgnify:CR=1 FL=1